MELWAQQHMLGQQVRFASRSLLFSPSQASPFCFAGEADLVQACSRGTRYPRLRKGCVLAREVRTKSRRCILLLCASAARRCLVRVPLDVRGSFGLSRRRPHHGICWFSDDPSSPRGAHLGRLAPSRGRSQPSRFEPCGLTVRLVRCGIQSARIFKCGPTHNLEIEDARRTPHNKRYPAVSESSKLRRRLVPRSLAWRSG
jgi:hypothetical protein